MLSPGRHGVFLLGSDAPMAFAPAAVQAQFSRPEVLADVTDVPDLKRATPEQWVRIVQRAEWLTDGQVDAFTGPGPLITDDRPRSEYFLWRRAFLPDKRYINETILRKAFPGS
jgi:hypothetical protein